MKKLAIYIFQFFPNSSKQIPPQTPSVGGGEGGNFEKYTLLKMMPLDRFVALA